MATKFSSLSNSQEPKQIIFQNAKDSNALMAWVLRVLGVVLVIMGLKLVLAPITLVTSFIPVLGSIVDIGAGLIAILLGISWSFIIISIAWIRFRPVLAIALLVISGALTAFIIWKGHSKKKSDVPSVDAQPE